MHPFAALMHFIKDVVSWFCPICSGMKGRSRAGSRGAQYLISTQLLSLLTQIYCRGEEGNATEHGQEKNAPGCGDILGKADTVR